MVLNATLDSGSPDSKTFLILDAQVSTENSRMAGRKLSFECPGRVSLNKANRCSGVSIAHCWVEGGHPQVARQTHMRSGTTALLAQAAPFPLARALLGSSYIFGLMKSEAACTTQSHRGHRWVFRRAGAVRWRQLVPLLQRELDSCLIELHSNAHRDAAQGATEVEFKAKTPAKDNGVRHSSDRDAFINEPLFGNAATTSPNNRRTRN